jgi:hypothetical protein
MKIEHCLSYDNEHCTECDDSYTLNANKRSCDLICAGT